MIKRLIILLCIGMMVLTSCSRSEYDDASEDVPENWASYSVGDLAFRFEAGWKSSSWDPLQTEMDTQAQTLGVSSNLALFGHLVAPAADKGTVNYVDFGYWETGRTLQDSELESIMETLHDLSLPMKKLGVNAEDMQNSRIRTYGKNETTALTLSYRLEEEKVSCVMQVAFVPHGSRVYMISYADFSKDTDDTMLEQLLSTLSFAS